MPEGDPGQLVGGMIDTIKEMQADAKEQKEAQKTPADDRADLLKKLRFKKTDLFGEIVKNEFAKSRSIRVSASNPSLDIKAFLKEKAMPTIAANQFKKEEWYGDLRRGFLALENSVKVSDEIANMFSEDASPAVAAAFGNFNGLAGKEIAFSLSYSDEGEFKVVKTDPAKAKKDEVKKEVVDQRVQDLEDSGVVGMVLGLLGIISDDDTPEQRTEKFRNIASGKSFLGSFVCGLLGYDFGAQAVAKVRNMIPSPEGKTALDTFQTKVSGFMGEMLPEVGEPTEVKDFVKGVDSKEAATALDKSFELSDNEELTSALEVVIPANASIRLLGKGGRGSVRVLENGKRVSEPEIKSEVGTRTITILGRQVLGAGTVFGAGVTVSRIEAELASADEVSDENPHVPGAKTAKAPKFSEDAEKRKEEAYKEPRKPKGV